MRAGGLERIMRARTAALLGVIECVRRRSQRQLLVCHTLNALHTFVVDLTLTFFTPSPYPSSLFLFFFFYLLRFFPNEVAIEYPTFFFIFRAAVWLLFQLISCLVELGNFWNDFFIFVRTLSAFLKISKK